MNTTVHIPVMPAEMLAYLDVKPDGLYIDATYGGGGHSRMILERGGRVFGIDRDPDALARGRARYGREIEEGKLRLVHSNHGNLHAVAEAHGVCKVDGVLMDLGTSSDQLDDPLRGFSFQHEGPLDMRMDTTAPFTAAELIATASEEELARIFRELGEEPRAKQFARVITRARKEQSPVTTTALLAALSLEGAAGRRRFAGRHPATLVFQALRMAVNREIEELDAALEAGLALLADHGKMVVITFESGTDRRVKTTFAAHAGRHVSLQEGGSRWEGKLPAVERLTRHAVAPSAEERAANPRARSAKLRAVRCLAAAEVPL